MLITARVQRQVAGLFVAEERGTHSLKGVPEPTTMFRLVRASGGGPLNDVKVMCRLEFDQARVEMRRVRVTPQKNEWYAGPLERCAFAG